MRFNFRAARILIAIVSICLISVVSAATLKSGHYFLNKDQANAVVKSTEKSQTCAVVKKDFSVAGFKISGMPEHQSYLLFLSGFFGIVGIGWVKRKKVNSDVTGS